MINFAFESAKLVDECDVCALEATLTTCLICYKEVCCRCVENYELSVCRECADLNYEQEVIRRYYE